MQKWPLLLVVTLSFYSLHAQEVLPINWSFSSEKVGESTYDLIFSAQLEPGWFIYVYELSSEDEDQKPVPFPVDIKLRFAPGFEPLGPPAERGTGSRVFDEILDGVVNRYSNTLQIVQRIRLSSKSLKQISGTIRYMYYAENRYPPPIEETFAIELK